MRKIEDIRASCEAATPGPWAVYNRSSDGADDPYLGYDIEPLEGSWLGRGMFAKQTDAAFIVNARQDIPDLLAALAEKDAEIERLEADRRRLIGFRHCPQCGEWLIDIDYGDGRIGGMGCIECDFEMEIR